ncbi:MAG: methyltransferase domain-containing protein [Planctomycetes bacterium]|nr:methyltransferase domain-containing protein [Planctomycetota bacterium]
MFRFVREAFRDIRHTGSVWPSSPALAKAMTRGLGDLRGKRRVLEVGPGTGPFTERILRGLRDGDHFDIVELNPVFCRELERRLVAPYRKRKPRMMVALHQAAIQEAPLEGPYDLIVCGLPFNNFPPTLVRSIFRRMMALLREGGELAYFEYAGVRTIKAPLVGERGRRQLKGVQYVGESLRRRHRGKRELVLSNIPPAVATHLRKSEATPAKRAPETRKRRTAPA